jgi:hypothetical protein
MICPYQKQATIGETLTFKNLQTHGMALKGILRF